MALIRFVSALITLAFGLVGAVGLAIPAVAASPPTPATIETLIDFTSFPFHGTFTVPIGADALGCAAGTFVDIPRGGGLGQIDKHIMCTSGPGAGDGFVVQFKHDCTFLSRSVFRCVPGPGVLNGHWMILSGSGYFATLHGSGDISIVFPGPVTGQETLVGMIHRD
jgi:hypothetical protein